MFYVGRHAAKLVGLSKSGGQEQANHKRILYNQVISCKFMMPTNRPKKNEEFMARWLIDKLLSQTNKL